VGKAVVKHALLFPVRTEDFSSERAPNQRIWLLKEHQKNFNSLYFSLLASQKTERVSLQTGLVICRCSRKFRGLPPYTFALPDGYVDWVQVIFNDPQAVSLAWRNNVYEIMFQNHACPHHYVHKRYALPCQIWFPGIEL
jgi:hypothetical protein